MAPAAAPYEARFNPSTGLWFLRDERGRLDGYTDFETRGDAEGWIPELIERDRVRALEEVADLDDFEAQQMAEAA